MGYFVVTREPGAGWAHSRPMREQDDWDAHARFMDGLVEAGVLVLGGLALNRQVAENRCVFRNDVLPPAGSLNPDAQLV
jgi:hypothetical protein